VIVLVPSNFADELAALTQQGYRVLALAHKTIHMQWHKAEKVKRWENILLQTKATVHSIVFANQFCLFVIVWVNYN